MMQTFPLEFREKVVFELRSLYNQYGYSQYKMNKFEEYDLYARNKDFLISDSVITFMDTNGKLMAMKPDVTLSIVKNTRDDAGCLHKMYYHENVYRAAKNSRSFREITQVGLECLGRIDEYCLWEVLMLAAESLERISPDWILDLSHQGLLAEVIEAAGIPSGMREQAMRLVSQKNVHELLGLCREWGVESGKAQWLKEVISLCGPAVEILLELERLLENVTDTGSVRQMRRVIGTICSESMRNRIRFDFSAVDNGPYYTGIVFKGFVNPLPVSVLSGGQYDRLMRKMGRNSGAIGFAVYMDVLESMEKRDREYDVDTMILYEEGTDLEQIQNEVRCRTERGERVTVQLKAPENLRYRRIVQITDGEVRTGEVDA